MFRIAVHLWRRTPLGVLAHTVRPSSAPLLRLLAVGLLLGLLLGPTPARPAQAAANLVFTVDSTAEAPDTSPGDGLCRAFVSPKFACTLRAAIQEANALPGLDIIRFSVGTGVKRISPGSPLPTITSPLVIDGTTQPGFAGTPIVELDGQSAGPAANGLTITGGGSTVRGLVINRFSANGIVLSFVGGNRIEGDFIGTDVGGTVALGNALAGVILSSGTNNRIGGTAAQAGNLISGNGVGVDIRGPASGNVVVGNHIGTDVNVAVKLGNLLHGVHISNARNNQIGLAELGNDISGNVESGVRITGSFATGNVVQHNFIGTDRGGTVALGNKEGVVIDGAPNNTIGAPGAGNLISGNVQDGVRIEGAQARLNVVRANMIGTDSFGTASLGNGRSGVLIAEAPSNTIGGTTGPDGNLISGNSLDGVLILGGGAGGNVVVGNHIGTNVDVTSRLGNLRHGVHISGAPNNKIGLAELGNDISGNGDSGVRITGSTATGNVVQHNTIGTDRTGTIAVGNNDGVVILGVPNNNIGLPGAGNLISGNAGFGVRIEGASASGNQVLANRIGTVANGSARLGNRLAGVFVKDAPNNRIGLPNAGNLISGNGRAGVRIEGSLAMTNVVQSNFIGTNLAGTAALGNVQGVVVASGAQHNVIGFGNVISGNRRNGVALSRQARFNQVQDNRIGTNATGTGPLANAGSGVRITNGSGNLIGGSAAASNTIVFNGGDGVFVQAGVNNVIRANAILANRGLGIDLGPDGVTPNDVPPSSVPPDNDVGPNALQNFPVLTQVRSGAVQTTISGRLDSTPNRTFFLEFFVQGGLCDASGHGEGERLLATTTVTTSVTGVVFFAVSVPGTFPVGTAMTATATSAVGNTSEFSQCATVTAAAPAGAAQEQEEAAQ